MNLEASNDICFSESRPIHTVHLLQLYVITSNIHGLVLFYSWIILQSVYAPHFITYCFFRPLLFTSYFVHSSNEHSWAIIWKVGCWDLWHITRYGIAEWYDWLEFCEFSILICLLTAAVFNLINNESFNPYPAFAFHFFLLIFPIITKIKWHQ